MSHCVEHFLQVIQGMSRKQLSLSSYIIHTQPEQLSLEVCETILHAQLV